MMGHYGLSVAGMGMVGACLAEFLCPSDVIGLSGKLGAGKTTLARGILRALGLTSEAPSPTFAILQPYAPPEVVFPIAHVDLYRLTNVREMEELGLDDYLYDGALLIEWPERMADRTYPDMLRLRLGGAGEGSRSLTAEVPLAWQNRWNTMQLTLSSALVSKESLPRELSSWR